MAESGIPKVWINIVHEVHVMEKYIFPQDAKGNKKTEVYGLILFEE